MPKKTKVSDWEERGIELIKEGLELYNEFDISALQQKMPRYLDGSQLRQKITKVGHQLHAHLHYDGRPTNAQIRAALEPIKKTALRLSGAAEGVSQSVKTLDIDSRRALFSSASKDPLRVGERPKSVEINGETFERPIGAERVNWRIADICKDVADLVRWIENAVNDTPAGTPGARGSPGIRWAVEELEKIWHEETGNSPTTKVSKVSGKSVTSSEFIDFCQIALNPVLNHWNLTPNLEGYVSRQLYS